MIFLAFRYLHDNLKKIFFFTYPLGTNTRKWSKTFKRIRRQFTDELLEFVLTILWGWR